MDPYKKYIMGQPIYRSRTSTRVEKKKRPPRNRKSSLQELDETIASAEQSQRSSSRRSRIDESSSVGSYTIATREGHSIYEHKNLIDNLQMMNIGSNSELNLSRSSYSRRSRQSRTSRRSNRNNLERIVTDTLLDSASWSTGAHFITTREDELSPKKLSTESILQDLDQASAIIENELGSTRSMRSSRSTYSRKNRGCSSKAYRESNPVCGIAEDSMFAGFDVTDRETQQSILNTSTDVVVLGKNRQRLVATPETSPSSSSAAGPAKRMPATPVLEDNSWPDVFEGLEYGKSSPEWTTTTASSSQSNSKATDPYNMDAFVTQEWTTFDDNPFFSNNSSNDQEHNSTDSPNSIVFLGSNKKRNRSKTTVRQRVETVATKCSI